MSGACSCGHATGCQKQRPSRHGPHCFPLSDDGYPRLRMAKPEDPSSTGESVVYPALFRCSKRLDLLVRPIRHRSEERGPAHIFLCMLASYVEWHMRQALAPILFEDEELEKDSKRRANQSTPAQKCAKHF